ncbi:Gti1/Pac2 family-domain-containing protein [Rhodocollybia butyracea]|uniref:Gti1/Pac2 family-domain-containing protein n=1 Tax=Rhodocollybia butyracea TaxID=206335 RepID=A0A9P5PA19_9AGAR|nr:Gti1/Pac2 family-domain-containing protein [Rhodocollybia butyracea]
MQQATHPRLHVRDERDAQTLFEAVRQGLLQQVTRRLDETERSTLIHSGSIFIWVESGNEASLKRWTDGRVWGQSRIRGPFLFYDEKHPSEGHSPEQNQRYSKFRFVDGPTRSIPASSALLHQDRSGSHTGLIKQAYSTWVVLPPDSHPRKWHLTAYFTYSDLPSIPTIDEDEMLSKISVPCGIYIGGKQFKADEVAVSHLPDVVDPPDTPSYGVRSGSCSASLPSLHSSVGSHALHSLPAYPTGSGSRISEDYRVIHILNSRHVS